MKESKFEQLCAQQIYAMNNIIENHQDNQQSNQQTQYDRQLQISKIVYKCGSIYFGSTVDNQRHGEGKQIYSNGNYYEGEWSSDIQDGIGIFKYNNGDFYQGEFFKGQFQGFGKYFYSQSRKLYIGFWLNNKWHGQGSLYSDQGVLLMNGKWEYDDLIQDYKQIEKKDSVKEGSNMNYIKKGIYSQFVNKFHNQNFKENIDNSQKHSKSQKQQQKSLASLIKKLLFKTKSKKLSQCLLENKIV